MARMRNLKPEFFRDKKIGQAGPQVALVYEALWCLSDDGGVAPIDPARVWGEMFIFWPSMTVDVVHQSLVVLTKAGRIRPYLCGDELYASIPTFSKHQKPKHPSEFRNPHSEQWVSADELASLPLSSPASPPVAGVSGPPVISYQVTGNRYQVSGSSAPNGAGKAEGSPPAWSRRAVEIATAAALQYEEGRYLRILKPFVKRDGAERALAHWAEFLKAGRHYGEDGKFHEHPGPTTLLRPERFRDTYAEWAPSDRSESA